MKNKRIINGGIIFLMLILLPLNVSAQTVEIEGIVVDFYGPVPEAEITIYDEHIVSCTNETCQSKDAAPNAPLLKSDRNGKFITYITPSYYPKTYNFSVVKENYDNKTAQMTLINPGNNSGNVTENRTLAITLLGRADVEGVVMDSDSGHSIEDADVTISDRGDNTDKSGYFNIGGIYAKTQTVTIEHDDYETQHLVYDIMPGDNFLKVEISKTDTNKDYAVSAYTNYPSLIIGSGETKEFEINIKNIGNKDATYDLSLSETEDAWKYRILNKKDDEINKIFVKSGQTEQVIIEVKAPEDAARGQHEFKLEVGSDKAEVELIADVGEATGSCGFSAFSMYRGKAVAGGSDVQFEITLESNDTDDIYRMNASVPGDWKYYVTNKEGDEITEVEIVKGKTLNLYLKLEPPDDENEGVYEPSIVITSLKCKETKTLSFQVTVRQEKELYDVVISSPFSKKSVMIGNSIEYSITIQNDGRKKDNYNLILVNLSSGWEYKFKESSGNAPQISSVEVPEGSTKNVVLQVNPASDVELGDYPFIIKVSGNANDTLNATLTIEGSHEMKQIIDNLYIQVDPGVKKQMTIKVQNTGLSELRDVELTVTAPDGWDVTATPAKVPSLKPQMTEQFTLNIEAPADASTGDFKVIVKATSQEFETAEDVIRVTVNKSSSSGYVGFALIAAAVIFLIIIFRKFGRK